MMKNRLLVRRAPMCSLLAAWAMMALAAAPGWAAAGKARAAGVQATRSAIHCAANKTGAQVRFCLAPEVAKSAQSPAKVTVNMGLFGGAEAALVNAADPARWSLYE